MIKTLVNSNLAELDNQVNAFMKEKHRNLPVRSESFVVGSLVMHKATIFFDEPMVSKASNDVLEPEPKPQPESAFEEEPIPDEDFDETAVNEPSPELYPPKKPNPDKLGALWMQKDKTISGVFKDAKLKIPDKWAVKIKELTPDSKIELRIRGEDCVIIRNKFKKTLKHPEFVVLKKRAKEE